MIRVLTRRGLLVTILVLGAVVLSQPTGSAQQSFFVPDVSELQLPAGAAVGPARPAGNIDVWVTLTDPSVAQVSGPKRGASLLTINQQVEYGSQLFAKQDALAQQVRALGGTEIARVSKAHNAVAIRIDASQLQAVAELPGVRSVRPVKNYSRDLIATVPYIGASALQSTGVDGTGIKVAVLDSGIDYTHRSLGGSGLVADYISAYGTSAGDTRNKSRDGRFPTAKVVEGYDFVGEGWPNAPLAPDNDPIDFQGHGTHVADIAAGRSTDGTHKGVAPGASLIAVKVCSTISTSCSGIALLQGVDFALDPNGDGSISDAVDVINMSLGSSYGQQEDDLSEASAVAVRFGVVVVAAAGNDGDRPYIVSSPSIGEGVISVAQTAMPTAVTIPLVINSPASIAGTYTNAATLDFAPIGQGTAGNVVFVGRGCPAGSISAGSPEDVYLANPAGKIALIDRGVCSISLKIDRAASAGATGVLIGLVAAGDAVGFAFGGGSTFVPSLVITQSTANLIKTNLTAPVNATISSSAAIPLMRSMVGSSARGPSSSTNSIKPDIGAPGASVSAIAGTGTGEEAFGGTSGATPVISGAAALILQAHPNFDPVAVRSALISTAETTVFTNPALLPGVLAPISRIGAGEVRVDRAVAAKTAAWDDEAGGGGVSFGYNPAPHVLELQRRVAIWNYDNKARSYAVSGGFRYASDEASGAVTLSLPATVLVPAGATTTFNAGIRIDARKLPTWNINGGNNGGNGALLDGLEFDGYLTIAEGSEIIHLPWHVLPHKAAAVGTSTNTVTLVGGTGTVSVKNAGVISGRVDIFSLTGTSGTIQNRPRPGDNFAVVDLLAVGARLANAGQPAIQFGIVTNGARSHPNYPAEFDVFIDSDRDGQPDFVVFNLENGGFATTGQNVVAVANLKTNTAIVRFFADADLDSSTIIMTVLLSDLGLTAATTFDFFVFSYDNYFTGNLTDSIGTMTYTPAVPRFVGSGIPANGVPSIGTSALTIQSVPGGATASPSQTGLLLLYRDAKPTQESSVIVVQ